MVGATQNAGPGQIIWKCDMCKVSLNSEIAYNQHLAGKKHQNHGIKPIKERPAKQGNEEPRNPPFSIQNKRPFAEKQFTGIPFKAWKCDVCEISLNSDFQYQEHMNSKKHHEVAMGISPSSTKKPSIYEANKEPWNPPGKPIPFKNKSPFSEKPFSRPPFKAWKCDICEISMNSDFQYNEHMNSKKHQEVSMGVSPSPKKKPSINEADEEPRNPIQKKKPFAEKPFAGPSFKAWKCDICEISLNSDFQYKEHMNSKKHQDVAMGISPSPKKKPSNNEANEEPQNTRLSIKNKRPFAENHFTGFPFKCWKCDICEISMNSDSQYQEHMNSKKHQDAAMGISPSTTKKPFNNEANKEARIPPGDTDPIKKDSPLSEKQVKAWKCDICEISMNSEFQYEEHMNSKKHQDVKMGIYPSPTKTPSIYEFQIPASNIQQPAVSMDCFTEDVLPTEEGFFSQKVDYPGKSGLIPSSELDVQNDDSSIPEKTDKAADSADATINDSASSIEMDEDLTSTASPKKRDQAQTEQDVMSPEKQNLAEGKQKPTRTQKRRMLRENKLVLSSANSVPLLNKRPAAVLAEESDEKPPIKVPALKCDVCNCLLNSPIQLKEHLNSKGHKLIATKMALETVNYNKMFSGKKAQSLEDKANMSLSKDSTAFDENNTAASKPPKSSPKKEFKCEICKRTMNSEFQFLEHLDSNNHKKKQEIATPGTGNSIKRQLLELKNKYQQMQKTSALSTQDLENQKIVLSLLQGRGKAPTPANLWKKCDTCNLIFKSNLQYKEHLNSRNHKMAFSRKNYSKNQDFKKGPQSEAPPSKNSKKCFACDIIIPSGYHFKQHMNSVKHKMNVSRNISLKIEDLKKKLEYVSKELPQGPGNFIPASQPMTNNSQKAFAWRQKTSEIMRNSDSQFIQVEEEAVPRSCQMYACSSWTTWIDFFPHLYLTDLYAYGPADPVFHNVFCLYHVNRDNRRFLPPPGTRNIPINAPPMIPMLSPMEVQTFNQPGLDPRPMLHQQINCERRVDAPPPGILPTPDEWNPNQQMNFERHMDGPPGILRGPNNQSTHSEKPINTPPKFLSIPNEFNNIYQPINFERPVDAPPGIIHAPFDFNQNCNQPTSFERRMNTASRALPPPSEWYQKQPRSAGMLPTPNEKNNFQNVPGDLQNVPVGLQNVPHRSQQFPEKSDQIQSAFRREDMAMMTDGTPFTRTTCELCNVVVNSQVQYTEHLHSKKHKKNEEMRRFQNAGLPQKQNLMREQFGALRSVRRCEICDFTLNSESQYIQHIESERHKLKVEIKLREQWSASKAQGAAIRRPFESQSRFQNFQNEPVSRDVTRREQDIILNSESERWKLYGSRKLGVTLDKVRDCGKFRVVYYRPRDAKGRSDWLLSEDDGNTVVGVNPPREMWLDRQHEDPSTGFRLAPPPLPPTVLRRGQF